MNYTYTMLISISLENAVIQIACHTSLSVTVRTKYCI